MHIHIHIYIHIYTYGDTLPATRKEETLTVQRLPSSSYNYYLLGENILLLSSPFYLLTLGGLHSSVVFWFPGRRKDESHKIT